MPDEPALAKRLAWDLDNTLRAGTLPEDPDVEPSGAPRDMIARLDSRGILQPVASKNDFDLAWQHLDGPDVDFLRSLELVMDIARADEQSLPRVEELTLRTSQMNATGVHYPHAVLRTLLADPDYEILTVTMADRFGPHGAVGVLLLEYHRAVWHLKLLATSCRVVSFGAWPVILNWLIDQAARAGVHLAADFRPTERNRMIDVAYRFAGFTDESCDCMAGLGTARPGDTGIAGTGNVRRLHLRAAPRLPSTIIGLAAPALAREFALTRPPRSA